jgi:hypothetical protein
MNEIWRSCEQRFVSLCSGESSSTIAVRGRETPVLRGYFVVNSATMRNFLRLQDRSAPRQPRLPAGCMIRWQRERRLTMRRRLGKFLPIILFALLVQILAPVAACLAASAAASDPLRAAVICHGAGTASLDPSDQTGRPARDGSCSQCCIAHSATPADTPRIAIAILTREPERVVWLAAAPELFGSRPGSQAQARAPPSLS